MENTDEIFEENALGSSVLEEIEHVAEQLGENAECKETEREIGTEGAEAGGTEPIGDVAEEDATMSVLRRFPKVCARIAELMNERAEAVALEVIGKGLDFENAVANADKEGYVRGKNEKIELIKGGRMPRLDAESADEDDEKPVRDLFPRYRKRSVWES